jgi:hypothetical protein
MSVTLRNTHSILSFGYNQDILLSLTSDFPIVLPLIKPLFFAMFTIVWHSSFENALFQNANKLT